MLPVAHVGHYLWALYVIPILIVAAAIVRNTIAQRQAWREDDSALADGESSTAQGGRFTDRD